MNNKKLSIIIPAYNEEKTISQLLEKVIQVKIPLKKEIIIVNDGSKDKTQQKCEEFIKQHPNENIVLINKKNGGKGSALKRGMEESTGDILLIQDADLEYDPEDYVKLIKPFENPKVKVVYGSRLKNKKNKFGHLSFLLGGIAVTAATDILFFAKLTDEPTCYKVFRKDLKELLINAEGNKFDWEPEVTAKILRKGYKIKEIPIRYYPRKKSEGKKINWKDGVSTIITLLKWRFKKIN